MSNRCDPKINYVEENVVRPIPKGWSWAQKKSFRAFHENVWNICEQKFLTFDSGSSLWRDKKAFQVIPKTGHGGLFN